jgi:hypothetical protein
MTKGRSLPVSKTYFTILASNYLPRAIALAESLQRHEGARLVVFFIDALDDADLPDAPEITALSTAYLGLEKREVLRLVTIYNLVEFATAVKPLLLKKLLEESEFVAYLDPDTYLTGPLAELSPAIEASEGGILLTPHFLEPVPESSSFDEGHLLAVGFFNLGFCAVDRRAIPFLDWWWSHLAEDCRYEPLSGLFVDQKWVDIGAPLFRAGVLRHYGYNVGVANLHERPLGLDDDGYIIEGTGDRLRLFHFHAFDTSHPTELSTRFDWSTSHMRDSEAVDQLCREYADALGAAEKRFSNKTPYRYLESTTGHRISSHIRRTYRLQSAGGTVPLPSPFLPEDAEAFESWRKHSRKAMLRELVGDTAKGLRLILPEEYDSAKKKYPQLIQRLRGRYVRKGGIWA